MAEPTDAPDLASQVRAVALPIGLIDLQSGNIVAISDMAAKFGPLRSDEILERPVLDRIHPEDRAGTAAALEAMSKGSVDLFRAWPMTLAEGPSRPMITWVRRLDIGDRRLALYELADQSQHGDSPLVAYLGHEPFQMAVGALDEAGKVTWISSAVSTILDIEADSFVGREFLSRVQRSDVDRVLAAGRDAGRGRVAAGVRIRLRNGSGEWQPVHLIIASLRGSRPLRLFILTPEPDRGEQQAARIADLEHHLWKIAGEVEASGILTRMGAVSEKRLLPAHSMLTARQWEVLGRLLHGERVPLIAEELFLSQSTVRGHVATILKRFGVHSQHELLKLLRGTSLSA